MNAANREDWTGNVNNAWLNEGLRGEITHGDVYMYTWARPPPDKASNDTLLARVWKAS